MNRVSLFLADRARAIMPACTLLLMLIALGATSHPALAQQMTAGPKNVSDSDNDYNSTCSVSEPSDDLDNAAIHLILIIFILIEHLGRDPGPVSAHGTTFDDRSIRRLNSAHRS